MGEGLEAIILADEAARSRVESAEREAERRIASARAAADERRRERRAAAERAIDDEVARIAAESDRESKARQEARRRLAEKEKASGDALLARGADLFVGILENGSRTGEP